MTSKAERSEYFSINAMGQVVCRLCDTMHRDEANFAVHLTSKRHTTNLRIVQLRREQLLKENEVKMAIAKDAANEKNRDQTIAAFGAEGAAAAAAAFSTATGSKSSVLTAAHRNAIGPPEVKVQVDAIGNSRMHSRVMFTVHYPLVASGLDGGKGATTTVQQPDGTTVTAAATVSRPMHRWLSTYEQTVEPRDETKQYLVFACDPYQTVAYCFPSNLVIATADNTDPRDIQRYFCRWDPVDKTYLLMFAISHR